MNSLEFLNTIINPARLAAGEKEIRNRDFIKRIMDELDLQIERAKVSLVKGNKVLSFDLDHDQMMLVGMRESKAARRTILAKLKELEQQAHPEESLEQQSARLIALLNEAVKAKTEEADDKTDGKLTPTQPCHRLPKMLTRSNPTQ